MATPLKKQLVRELTKFPGVLVTLTENGLSLKVKRRHKSIEIPWEIIFGSGAMLEGDNKQTMLRGGGIVLHELGYHDFNKGQE